MLIQLSTVTLMPKLSRPDLSNSDDGQAGANLSHYRGVGAGGDDDIEDWVLWDKITMIFVRYHYVPHLVVNHLETDKCPFLQTNFYTIISATLLKEITTETNRQVGEKISEAVPLKNPYLGHMGRHHNQRADGISWYYTEHGKTCKMFCQGPYLRILT